MKFLQVPVYIVLGLLCLGVALGFAGRVHPAGDSLSLLRMPLGAMCLLMALLPAPVVLRGALLVSGLVAAITTVPAFVLSQTGGTLTVYTKNMWYRNDALPALAADIRDSGASVVMLQEVSQRNDALLVMLGDDFPHQHLCRFAGWSGIAVLSKHKIENTACSSERAMAAAQMRVDGQTIWAAAVHLPWPYPYSQAQSTRSAIGLLETLDGPIVIGGDFNIFPWATSTLQIKQASGTQMAGPLRPTFDLRGLPLLLDHVYAPGGGKVATRPLLGSDHLGVLATVNMKR